MAVDGDQRGQSHSGAVATRPLTLADKLAAAPTSAAEFMAAPPSDMYSIDDEIHSDHVFEASPRRWPSWEVFTVSAQGVMSQDRSCTLGAMKKCFFHVLYFHRLFYVVGNTI